MDIWDMQCASMCVCAHTCLQVEEGESKAGWEVGGEKPVFKGHHGRLKRNENNRSRCSHEPQANYKSRTQKPLSITGKK